MDEKFSRRFKSFCNSLNALAEARQRDLSDSFVLSGTSAKFSITFDLAWEVMKDILVQYYAIIGFVAGSPREVLREAFKANLISDDTWMEMLKVRNELAHDYDGDIVRTYCNVIVEKYIDLFFDFESVVKKLFEFNKDFFTLENDSVRLELIDTYAGNDKELPFYWWNIISKSRNVNVGKISFRIGHNYHSYYNGNIGYEVDEEYRGNHYALLACRLMPDVARYYGMDKLYLTCDFDNVASYKTIEKLGARLIEEVQPPKDYVFYYEGMPKQRIYELKI